MPKAFVDLLVRACDVYVIPTLSSRYSEAQLSAKIFEPMVLGKPIVATDVGDTRRILGRAGIIVPPGNVAELSSAIQRVLSDRRLAERLGRMAKQRSREIIKSNENKVSLFFRELSANHSKQ